MQCYAEGRFKVYLQPKINLQTGLIEGAEALVRKIDDQGVIIAPDNFIPGYEENGLINYIDIFVLKTVCRMLKDWRERGGRVFKMSVNVSRVTLIAEDTIKNSVAICKKYGIDPCLIDVEITDGITSVLNPASGMIRAQSIDTLILDPAKTDPAETQIVCDHIGCRLDKNPEESVEN